MSLNLTGQAAKTKLIFCFEVSRNDYKPLKKILFEHVSTLGTLLNPEPGKRYISLAEVIWRFLRPRWSPARYQHQSVMVEMAEGGGLTTTECGFYAYLANDRLLNQGFREIAASGQRITLCLAAPDSTQIQHAAETHLDASFQLVVTRIPEGKSIAIENWQSEVGKAVAEVFERISAFAEEENLIFYVFGY